MEYLVEAVQRELRELGRLLSPDDFGPYASLVHQVASPPGTRRAPRLAGGQRPAAQGSSWAHFPELVAVRATGGRHM